MAARRKYVDRTLSGGDLPPRPEFEPGEVAPIERGAERLTPAGDKIVEVIPERPFDAMKLLESGREVFLLFIQLFVFTTLLSMAGGALPAKTVGRS